MAMKYFFLITIFVFFVPLQQGKAVEQGKQHQFQSGSYQQILKDKKEQPFMLAVWSVSCSSCLKEMEQISKFHKKFPNLEIIMLSVDDFSEKKAVREILHDRGIADLESWIFSESNDQKLRFEIDPGWYGELPRTYFYNTDHQRLAISGTQTDKQFISMISGILTKDK